MRLAIAALALLAVAAESRGCGRTAHDPCAGASCGTPCRACPPDDARCVETAVVKACGPDGACVAATPDLCPPPYDPCAGKACHAPCQLCAPGDTGCMEPLYVKWCDGQGACVAEGTGAACPAPPYDPCAGKACHAPCQLCAPGDTGCMEPLYLKWCDGQGACVPDGTGAACGG